MTRLRVYAGGGTFRILFPQGGSTPYNGLYGEAPPERGTLSGFRYMKGKGFLLLKYMKG